MLFKPVLIREIIEGRKTNTRRLMVHRDGKPILYRAGHEYAIQPGRGKSHVAHIAVSAVDVGPLGELTVAEAHAEGFGSPVCFQDYWKALHGRYDRAEIVASIAFTYAGRRDCCNAFTVDPG